MVTNIVLSTLTPFVGADLFLALAGATIYHEARTRLRAWAFSPPGR